MGAPVALASDPLKRSSSLFIFREEQGLPFNASACCKTS